LLVIWSGLRIFQMCLCSAEVPVSVLIDAGKDPLPGLVA